METLLFIRDEKEENDEYNSFSSFYHFLSVVIFLQIKEEHKKGRNY